MNYNNPDAGKGFGITGLILGILGIILFCIPFVGLAFGVIGLILSIVGLAQANKERAQKSLIIGALVVSIIASMIGGAYATLLFKAGDKNFWQNMFDEFGSSDYDDDSYFYDVQEELDKLDKDFDSLNLDSVDIENLDKSMSDKENGPGSAPED